MAIRFSEMAKSNQPDGYDLLLEAVVIQACDDYRYALRGKRCKGVSVVERKPTPKNVIKEIERFFHSDRFKFFTSADPDVILKKLHEEYADGLRLIEEGRKHLPEKSGQKNKSFFVCPKCGGEAYAYLTKHISKGKTMFFENYVCTACGLQETKIENIGRDKQDISFTG